MAFITEFLKLTRFEHAVMLAFAVLIGETVVIGSFPLLTAAILLSLLVPVFSEMASFSLNDYLDIGTDKINNKKRPLVTGTISPQFALYFSFFAFALSTMLAYFINTAVFAIAIAFNLLAILYNWKLKDLPLIGNIYIGLSMAIPFIFGNLVVYPWLLPIPIILALLAFVAGVAREIIKSVQDLEGDIKARRSKTLPVIIGEKQSILIASVLYILFIPLSFAPFYLGLSPNIYSILLIAAADGILLGMVAALLFSPLQRTYKIAGNASLILFAIGMLAILYASLAM
ncbi:UbiA family prenyltransferase [Candidatus Micrarchaeota archaeon]|nr:UbiA family prenyltransferase [Candidatus Micrarchaeota archaeon]